MRIKFAKGIKFEGETMESTIDYREPIDPKSFDVTSSTCQRRFDWSEVQQFAFSPPEKFDTTAKK